MLTHLRIAAKHILKSKGPTVLNILGLAIGTSACLAIWLLIRFELSYDTNHQDSNRIYRLTSEWRSKTDGHSWFNSSVPMPTADYIQKELTGIETVAGFHVYNATVTIQNNNGENKVFPKATNGHGFDDLIFAQPDYFNLFQYKWIAGNPTASLTQPYQVVITTKQAQKYFGATENYETLIGRSIIYDDTLKTTLTGIVADPTGNTDLTFTDFISYSTIDITRLRWEFQSFNWGATMSLFQVFVKLEPSTTSERFEKELDTFAKRHFQIEGDKIYKAHIQPLKTLHYDDDYGKDYGRQASLPTLYGLLGIAAIILIIAAINFVNLTLAQSLQRVKEIGIRKILGSSRKGLIVQFLTEAFLLSTIAIGISLALVKPILAAFPAFIPPGVQINILNPYTVGFLIGLLVTTTLLAGGYPSWILSSFHPADAIRSRTGIKGGFRDNLRKGLIVFQFSISLAFIIASIVVGNQLRFLLTKNLGFTQDAIITLNTNGKDSLAKRQSFASRVRRLQGVAAITMDDQPPLTRSSMSVPCIYPGTPRVEIGANLRRVDERYLPLYKIKLLAGRNFFPEDTLHTLILNATCARLLGFRDPQAAIGKSLQAFGINATQPTQPRYRVIGVVADFNTAPLTRMISPLMIQSNPQSANAYSIKLKTRGKAIADFTRTMQQMERLWAQTFPHQPFVYHFYDEAIADFYQNQQKTAQVVYLAMGIAVFLSCMGLFALAALTAENRRKEIGIRKVMGATIGTIVFLLSKDFLKPVALAILIASPIAGIALNKWLQTFAYRTTIQWWIYAAAAIGALLIAFLTVSLRTLRAAKANPVESLRIE
jgi:putative ABC transport system permease protein